MEGTGDVFELCPEGHECEMTKKEKIKINGQEETDFECNECQQKVQFKDGVYVCCGYVLHEKCASVLGNYKNESEKEGKCKGRIDW